MSYDVKLTDVQPLGQGPAKLATIDDLLNDQSGYTNPNLHRRILSDDSKVDHIPKTDDEPIKEYKPRDYTLTISSKNSYRITESYVHCEEYDENSDNDEAP